MRRKRDDEDEELLDGPCSHDADFFGQALVRPHERCEVVTIDGRDVLRRYQIDPCPDHLDAIRRARAYSEEPTRYARVKTKGDNDAESKSHDRIGACSASTASG